MNQQHLAGYFDYNATTPISNAVIEAMAPALHLFANPSSNNSYSIKSKQVIVEARESIAQLINAQTQQMFFTSGGSEANNWAIKGVLFKHILQPGHIITTSIEHASVLDTVKYCVEHFGFEVTYLKANAKGYIEVDELNAAIRSDTQLITMMYANNETGVIQPIVQVAALAEQYDIPFHVDAVQIVGKRQIDLTQLNIDYLSLSAHKFYGPKGVGCLYIKDIKSISPLIHGGGQELSMRSGTENFVSLIGMAKAAQEAMQDIESWDKNNWNCKQHMISLLERAPIEVSFNGSTDYDKALSNTLNISVAGVRGEALATRLEVLHGYIISIGSACSNNKVKQHSHVLLSMGLTEEAVQSAVRVSFGHFTSIGDVEGFVAKFVNEVKALHRISGREYGPSN